MIQFPYVLKVKRLQYCKAHMRWLQGFKRETTLCGPHLISFKPFTRGLREVLLLTLESSFCIVRGMQVTSVESGVASRTWEWPWATCSQQERGDLKPTIAKNKILPQIMWPRKWALRARKKYHSADPCVAACGLPEPQKMRKWMCVFWDVKCVVICYTEVENWYKVDSFLVF
jgi:hypothetical protein